MSPNSPALAYSLVTVDASPASSAIAAPVTVSWHGLSSSVKTKGEEKKQVHEKTILDSVSGHARPGELLAVVGPSGSGKTTLLESIVRPTRATAGTVHLNGRPWSPSLAPCIAYVPRDDDLVATITVLQHLFFQAELRLDANATDGTRAARVGELMEFLGLDTVSSSLVDQVNGAQKKLLAIATQLLANPSVLILDNPTHGLDVSLAELVIEKLHALAQRGLTVIASLHHPPGTVFPLLDKLFLLADGHTVYHGKASNSIAYFAEHGLPCPQYLSPIEFFVQQLTSKEPSSSKVSHSHHLISVWPKDDTVVLDKPDDVAFVGGVQKHNSAGTQLSVLFRRNARRALQDTMTIRKRIGSMIVLALIIGLLFIQLDIDQMDIQPFSSATYFIAASQFIPTAILEFSSVPHEVALVLHEHEAGLYHAVSWYITKNISELPFQFLYPAIFLVPTYFLVGYTSDAEIFFTFYLFVVLIVTAATGLGYFASCVGKTPGMAKGIGLLILVPSVLFGGTFVNRKTTPSYFVWLQQILPVKYGYHGMMRAFWSHVDKIACLPNAPCRATSGMGVLTLNVIKPDHLVSDALILLTINLTLRVVGGLVLWRRAAAARRG